MPRLRNPKSGTVDDFTEGQAKVRRRKGWVDVDDNRLDTSANDGPVRAPAIAASTTAQVEEWVGDDPDRALEALELEESRPDGPRKALVEKLEPIAVRPPADK